MQKFSFTQPKKSKKSTTISDSGVLFLITYGIFISIKSSNIILEEKIML